ncbi:hypothetical protein C6N75_13855 [Streptomyces solincola]|uniref:DUF2867 domain-containing protein n=1 Tax=Streptomyces solincola TaxID=2100817 RepID=A0A2S9PW40_9ACTN|nr:hypothetical protein [Streptomyces solincola]PRH78631.1 hypothetical protein C6N75_13855 [Streptomyces solincola]
MSRDDVPAASAGPGVPPGLPLVDEHRVRIAAGADRVWAALGGWLGERAGPGAAAYARLVRAEPAAASGAPLAEGATLPGFRVARAVPGERAVLTGRHCFSRYAAVPVLTGDGEGGTVLAVRTYARFPGPLGAVYRALVFGSGGHAVAVRRMLDSVRRRAEG